MAATGMMRFDETTEQRIRNVFPTLSEKDRRRFAAIQAVQLGYGGISDVVEVLGCSIRTISRGIEELDQLPVQDTPGRVRREGAGRPKNQIRLGPRIESASTT